MSAPPPRPAKRSDIKEVLVVQALYDYTASQPDELSFTEGSTLYVLDKQDPNWWKCRSGDKVGMVPSNYVGENTTTIENPLHEAAKRGNLSFARELVATGISVNGLDKAGNSPLHWACRGGHSDIVELLFTKNPAINAQNKLGDTPLHMAAWGGHLPTVNLLLTHSDIDVAIKNNSGQTAQSLAKNDAVAAALIQHVGSASFVGYSAADVDSDDD